MAIKNSDSEQPGSFFPGSKVTHPELGEGVVTGIDRQDFFTVFFRAHGERQVPADSLAAVIDPYDQIVQSMSCVTPARIEAIWLALEAEQLPLMWIAPPL